MESISVIFSKYMSIMSFEKTATDNKIPTNLLLTDVSLVSGKFSINAVIIS